VTCTPASGLTFHIRSTSVTCSARDARGNTATGGFQVSVLSPEQIAAEILADIVTRNFREAIPLLQTLIALLNRSHLAAACGQLNAFISQVHAPAGKRLTTTQANRLIERASALATLIGCRPSP